MRVFTGWFVGGKVFEVASFDDLDGEAAGGGVIHEAEQDLWSGPLTSRLEGRGGISAGRVRYTHLRLTALKHTNEDLQICTLL